MQCTFKGTKTSPNLKETTTPIPSYHLLICFPKNLVVRLNDALSNGSHIDFRRIR